MNLGVYDRRPESSVIAEIKSIPNKNVFILDDNFLLSPDRIVGFCKAIYQEKIKKNFIIYATSRFIARHPELMEKLRDAGLKAVMVGFESISDEDLTTYKKGSNQFENEATVKICNELDIELIALFMLNPDWTSSEFIKLARYVRGRKIYLATYATLTTIPGTDLWESSNSNNDKLWRYDLLRLHQKPKYMSALKYYLWMAYLYLSLAYRRDALLHFYRRSNLRTTLKMFVNAHLSIFDFLIKATIWP